MCFLKSQCSVSLFPVCPLQCPLGWSLLCALGLVQHLLEGKVLPIPVAPFFQPAHKMLIVNPQHQFSAHKTLDTLLSRLISGSPHCSCLLDSVNPTQVIAASRFIFFRKFFLFNPLFLKCQHSQYTSSYLYFI